MKILSCYRSSRSTSKYQTSQVIRNFNLILLNESSKIKGFKIAVTRQKSLKISNFVHRDWNVELAENRISTNYVFLVKTIVITNIAAVANISYISTFSFPLLFFHNSDNTLRYYSILSLVIFILSLLPYFFKQLIV